MKKGGCLGIGVLALLAIAVMAVMWGTGIYNGLVKQDENVKNAWGNVCLLYTSPSPRD